MKKQDFFNRYPELKDIIDEIVRESHQSLRPPEQVILDDVDLQKILKCSKRKTAELREKRLITYSKPEGKIYYILSDVFEYLERSRIPAIVDYIKFQL